MHWRSGPEGTKSKPIDGPHLVYGFLTTAANAVVAPMHSKATPLILTTDEERDVLDACIVGVSPHPRRQQSRCAAKMAPLVQGNIRQPFPGRLRVMDVDFAVCGLRLVYLCNLTGRETRGLVGSAKSRNQGLIR